jgi:riboflavin kinase / FMN adenylyltransferase
VSDHPQELSIPQTYTSIIVKGEQQGRTMGFPTANFLRIPGTNQLGVGIYFGWIEIELNSTDPAVTKPCLAYFGPRHIKSQTKNIFEVHIYDFDQNIYGKSITVTITHFLREPKKTTNVQELIELINHDKEQGSVLAKSEQNPFLTSDN